MMRAAIGTALAVLCVAVVGCGYTVRSSLDEAYQTIHVAAFTNEGREYDLQAPLTNAIIRKFITDTRLRVVPRARADLVMEGAILNYELRGLTFDRNDEVTQFLTMMTARVRVIDNQTGTSRFAPNPKCCPVRSWRRPLRPTTPMEIRSHIATAGGSMGSCKSTRGIPSRPTVS